MALSFGYESGRRRKLDNLPASAAPLNQRKHYDDKRTGNRAEILRGGPARRGLARRDQWEVLREAELDALNEYQDATIYSRGGAAVGAVEAVFALKVI